MKHKWDNEGRKGTVRYRERSLIGGPEISMTPKNCDSRESSKITGRTGGFG